MDQQLTEHLIRIESVTAATAVRVEDLCGRVEKIDDRTEKAETKLAALELASARDSERRKVLSWVGKGVAGVLGGVATLLGKVVWQVLFSVVVLLVGCAAPIPFQRPDRVWEPLLRPVPVNLDASMPAQCAVAEEQGREFWRALGVEFEAPKTLSAVSDERVVVPPPVAIATTTRDDFGVLYWVFDLDEWTAAFAYPAGALREINRCSIVVREKNCTWQVFAHEYGHCLGLQHSPDPDALMYFSQASEGGEYVSPEEIDWVTK